MTDRLYYDNAYLLDFDANVVNTKARDGRYFCALDRSAFYPTSGGQPYDTGTLNGVRVIDVFVDSAGEVWHETETKITEGTRVHGTIDVQRRRDHMEQHAADHMIAGALYELCGATTIGLHIGDTVSSIDVQFADGTTRPDDAIIARVEDIVNDRIRANGAIRCWFPEADELTGLPLRKAPTVKEHVRIVAIGDYEMVACGGTHPARTGEIGLVKILEVTPARGKARVVFVAGKRAFEHFRADYDLLRAASNTLTTNPENLPAIVALMKNDIKETEKRLKLVQKEVIIGKMDQIMNLAARRNDGVQVIATELEADAGTLKEVASLLIRESGLIVLLGAKDKNSYMFVFARSKNVKDDMTSLIHVTGSRGGGRPDFAQGSGTPDVIDRAKAAVMEG